MVQQITGQQCSSCNRVKLHAQWQTQKQALPIIQKFEERFPTARLVKTFSECPECGRK